MPSLDMTKVKCECGGSLNIDSQGQVEESYIPGYYIRGRFDDGLPRKVRDAVIISCNQCEYCEEVK